MGVTPVCQITVNGIVRPTFAECLSYEQTQIRAIYGQDLYLGADSQDGQLVALRANAYHDANGETVAAYNSFSPATAIGVPLDRVVKINGIRRKRATYSTAALLIIGQVGITISGGIVRDAAGNDWALPATVLIPDSGQILVNVTCQTLGAIALPALALDTRDANQSKGSIATVTRGWQSAYNPAAASTGQPIESDSELRQRQALSTAIPSQTLLDGLYGALSAVSGVNRLTIYENDEAFPDANGIPGGAIAVVMDGGDPQVIAKVIRLKKGPGVSTFGSTKQTVTSTSGIPKNIAFTYLAQAPIGFALTVSNIGGFTETIQMQIQASLATFVNGLAIGEHVRRDQAFAAAKLYDGAGSKTYRIEVFAMGRIGSPFGRGDVPILFNEAATADAGNVAVTVLPATS